MIDRIKYRITMLRALLPYYDGVKKLLVVNLLISFGIMILTYIYPILYKIFIDEVIIGGQIQRIKIVLLGYFAVFITNTVLGYIKLFCHNKTVNTSTYRVKMKIWNNIIHKEFDEYDSMNYGDYQMKIGSDVDEIEQFADTQTIGYAINIIAFIILTVILIMINWKLAIISFLIIPVTFYLDTLVGKGEKALLEIDRLNREEQATWMHNSIQGWKEVKALNLKEYEVKKLFYFINVFEGFFGKWNLYATTRKLVLPKIKDEFVMQFIMYFVGGLFILKGNFTIGSLLIFMQYYSRFSETIKNISGVDTDLLTGKVKSERILKELEIRYKEDEQKKKLGQLEKIEFRNVCFKYPLADKGILNDVSFQINKGERVAIVGRSGSGKTTIIKLMLGILKKDRGMISINNEEIESINIKSIHKKIGIIMQENFLFDSTIKENLLLGKPDASMDECVEACKKANINDFIMSLPQQLDTVIGERGIKLSGGQKQRIVLARAFLKDAEAYIFDEATSALDQYSESLIHDVINEICEDKTIIVIAHRQSSIDLCNRIITIS